MFFSNATIVTIIFALIPVLYLLKRYANGGVCNIMKDLEGKVIVITGANTGIGKETAKVLAKMDATLVLACRDKAKTEAAIEEIKSDTGNQKIEFIPLDLQDFSSIKKFSDEFHKKYQTLDILLNNAGIMMIPKRTLTKDGLESQIGTNHFGHMYLTTLLLDRIKAVKESRIINVSSLAHETGSIFWDDLMLEKNYNPIRSYHQSKLANVLFTRELQKKLGNKIKVASLHPGVVRTELARNFPLFYITMYLFWPIWWFVSKSSLQGAQTSLYCCLCDFDSLVPGGYYSDCKIKKTNKIADDPNACTRFWDLSVDVMKSKGISINVN